jgi:hypothetical protein
LTASALAILGAESVASSGAQIWGRGAIFTGWQRVSTAANTSASARGEWIQDTKIGRLEGPPDLDLSPNQDRRAPAL